MGSGCRDYIRIMMDLAYIERSGGGYSLSFFFFFVFFLAGGLRSIYFILIVFGKEIVGSSVELFFLRPCRRVCCCRCCEA